MSGPWRCFAYGQWMGTLVAMGIYSWLWGALRTFFEVSLPLTLVLFLLVTSILGLQFGVFVALAGWLRDKLPVPFGILGAALYALCEFWAPVPCPISPSLSFAWTPILLQMADLGGMTGIALLCALVNGAVYESITAFRKGRITRVFLWAGFGVFLVAFQTGYGAYRMKQYSPRAQGETLRVGMIQPVAPLKVMNSDEATKKEVARKLVEHSRRAMEEGSAEPDLLVWPEGAAPFSFTTPAFNPEYLAELKPFQDEFAVPLIAQDIEFTRLPDSEKVRYYSATTLIDASGAVAGRYRKNYLVPFAEFLPGEQRFPLLKKVFQQSRSILRGEEQNLLPGPKGPFAPLVCYEILFEDYVRKSCNQGAHYIVNLTNDLWYGAEQQPWQHLAYAVYRSVENRVPVIRCTNSGISALIDATGAIEQDHLTQSMERTFLVGEIYPRSGGSFYAEHGDILVRWVLTPVFLLCLCYAWFAPAFRSARKA
jgi:apolipoprotein N-acyltransferase